MTSASSTGSETILLVDDEAAVRLVTRRLLQRFGYTVLEADSGEQALRVAEQYGGPIDLVLTDVMMPGMGGRTVASEVLRTRPRVRVLFMSGHAAEVIAQQGIAEEEVGFLQKPFSPAGLQGRIRELLDTAEGGSEL